MAYVVKVSVIMNCYNCSQDLKLALDSLMAQTFQDFEVIFFDNASTDNSCAIAQSFGPKIRYFRSEKTVPLGAARNLALKEARGELMAFLDCDDFWEKEKLALQVALFEADPLVGLVTCDTWLFKDGKKVGRVFAKSLPARGLVFRELLQRQWISMSSAMVSRKALASLSGDLESWQGDWFDESLNVCEEADVFYRLAYVWKLDYVDKPLSYWRIHSHNTTFAKYGLFAKETKLILAKLKKLHPEFAEKYPDLVELLTRRALFQEAVDLWHQGKGAKARGVLKPYKRDSLKLRLFWFCSYLPGSWFDFLARIYFALPKIKDH
ncbi:MAG: glycosyltransferase family 2 protein [Desulfovibrionaceae bacterium]|nr:glycosyltransferase family 2 protein [Desulfovibrionaceae bacterium]